MYIFHVCLFVRYQENEERALEIQLDHSASSLEGGCPLFVPSPGVDALHQYAQLSEKQQEDIGKSLVPH